MAQRPPVSPFQYAVPTGRDGDVALSGGAVTCNVMASDTVETPPSAAKDTC